jgi:hypothetical protein
LLRPLPEDNPHAARSWLFLVLFQRFAPLFRARSWRHAEVLLVGAILAPGQRTVTSILRVSGLARERCFVNYHRVLNRAAWSGREAARVLLGLLLAAFAPRGPVIGSTTRSSAGVASASAPRGSTADPVRSSMATSSRRAAFAG